MKKGSEEASCQLNGQEGKRGLAMIIRSFVAQSSWNRVEKHKNDIYVQR